MRAQSECLVYLCRGLNLHDVLLCETLFQCHIKYRGARLLRTTLNADIEVIRTRPAELACV